MLGAALCWCLVRRMLTKASKTMSDHAVYGNITMESHNTMQEASDQQARCKKQQKTRHTCHHECRGHTPTCIPQPAHPNLHFDSAKHAYITNNRSKAEPEILSALLPWQLCFSRQARLWFSSHAQQAPNCDFQAMHNKHQRLPNFHA